MIATGGRESLRVLLIGAGRRIQNNFLPAFRCLQPQFELMGIHSRTPQRLHEVAARWKVSPVEAIDDHLLAQVNLVAISINTENVPSVLEKLRERASNLVLLIDTPVIAAMGDFAAVRQLRSFRRVVVAEDYMNFPQFSFLRDLVSRGTIGKLQSLQLSHNAYNYHGFALARSFFGLRFPRTIISEKLGGRYRCYSLRFRGGGTAILTEPYDPPRGRLMISGSSGMIVDYALDGDGVWTLDADSEGGMVRQFRLRGGDGPEVLYRLPHVDELMGMPFDNKSAFNIQKTIGLIDILKSCFEVNINTDYSYTHALYDHFAPKASYRLARIHDPFAVLSSSMLRIAPWSGSLFSRFRGVGLG